MARKGYSGWELDAEQRTALLKQFPPAFPNISADHVTLHYGVMEECPDPAPVSGQIVGYSIDHRGIEAFVVSMEGYGTVRPDEEVFHITWSYDDSQGYKPQQSKDLISERGYRMFAQPIPLKLTPRTFS